MTELRTSEHPEGYKYRIGGTAVANTLLGALEQKRVICRLFGRNPRAVFIVLTETGQIVTRGMGERLKAEENASG